VEEAKVVTFCYFLKIIRTPSIAFSKFSTVNGTKEVTMWGFEEKPPAAGGKQRSGDGSLSAPAIFTAFSKN